MQEKIVQQFIFATWDNSCECCPFSGGFLPSTELNFATVINLIAPTHNFGNLYFVWIEFALSLFSFLWFYLFSEIHIFPPTLGHWWSKFVQSTKLWSEDHYDASCSKHASKNMRAKSKCESKSIMPITLKSVKSGTTNLGNFSSTITYPPAKACNLLR